MAQFLLSRRYWKRIHEEWNRRGPGVASRFHVGLRANLFIDYFMDIPGTVPEKILFNILYQSGVNFHFARYLGDIPFTSDEYERYRPDFILPDYHIIIEVQGDYWHGRVGSYERDYNRALKLSAVGFTVYTVYDKDLLLNPWEALRHIPPLIDRLAPGAGWFTTSERPQDPRASLRALRQKWPRKVNVRPPSTTARRRAVLSSFFPNTRRPSQTFEYGPVFTSEALDQGLLAEWKESGSEWYQWLIELGDILMSQPKYSEMYPEYLEFYNKWIAWYNRYI